MKFQKKKIELPKSILKELNSKSLQIKPQKKPPKEKRQKIEKIDNIDNFSHKFTREELEQDNLQEIFKFDFPEQDLGKEDSDSEFLKEKRKKKTVVKEVQKIKIFNPVKDLGNSKEKISNVGIKRILNKLTFENLEFSIKEILQLFKENSRKEITMEIINAFFDISKTQFTNLQTIVLNGLFSCVFFSCKFKTISSTSCDPNSKPTI